MAKWPYGTKAWRKLRAAKLRASPHCAACHRRGQLVMATNVDHNVAISRGGEPFPDLCGLTSLCQSCHSKKTQRFDRLDRRPKGCDVHGNPLDPSSGWHG